MHESSDASKIRGLLPIVVVGLALTIIALTLLLWPTGQFGDESVTLIPHLSRLLHPLINETGLNIPRRLLDGMIYFIVLAGVIFLVTAWRRGTHSALVGLIGVAILGLAYVSSMALYTGPMIANCGFLLILFGGLVAWATSHDEQGETVRDENEESAEGPVDSDTSADPAEQTDTTIVGTNENASPPVA